ncbi:MAG: hypothetical protein PGN25_17470 [Methylorubrum populi]
MVIGLVASSPLVREQHSAQVRLQPNLAASRQVEGDAWIDPPRAKVRIASTDAARNAGEGKDSSLQGPKPASFTLLSPETVALLAAGDTKPTIDRPERAQAPRRHRTAKVASRTRPPAAADVPAVTAPAAGPEAVAPQPQKAARIDPIGDLLRGLGIGRDS